VVSSEQVPNPVAVHYAWGDRTTCNLFNLEGLLASPFRTDNWPGVTDPVHLQENTLVAVDPRGGATEIRWLVI
jgi:hypothetical protein